MCFLLALFIGNLEDSVIYVGTEQLKSDVKEEVKDEPKEAVNNIENVKEEAIGNDDEGKDDSVIYVGTSFAGSESPMTLLKNAFESLKLKMKKE